MKLLLGTVEYVRELLRRYGPESLLEEVIREETQRRTTQTDLMSMLFSLDRQEPRSEEPREGAVLPARLCDTAFAPPCGYA